MKRIVQTLIIYFFFTNLLCAQIVSPSESYILSFINQSPNNKFVIRTDFSFVDTISLSKLPLSPISKTFTNQAIKIPPEQILKPVIESAFIPELKTNFKYQFTVFYKTNYFTIDINPEENKVYSISCGIKSGDYTEQLSISFNNNVISVYNIQKVRTVRNGNTTNYDIIEGKRIDFIENPTFSKTNFSEELQLCEKMLEFGLGIIYYLKNKNCAHKDYLAGRKIFTPKHLFFINRALDSLIRMYAMQEQVNENITNLKEVKESELIISITFTNHYKDGHIYEVSEPRIVKPQKTTGNMNYFRICTTIREVTDKIIKNVPTPKKYCLPIKYTKTVYIYYSQGKVVKIEE